MFTIPSIRQILNWFGWSHDAGHVAAVSGILVLVVIFLPVVAGYVLYGVERLQMKLMAKFNVRFANFFACYATFPGTFVHEMSHLIFAVFTGANVTEICIFESGDRLGHIGYIVRGPKPLQMVQHALSAVAPTIVGFTLGYFLLQYIFNSPHVWWEHVLLWYLVVSLIDHSTMSNVDLSHYLKNVWIFVVPLFVAFFAFGMLG